MDIEQLSKQIDFIDDERRKDKTRLVSTEDRLAAVESNVTTLPKQIKDLSSEITRLTAMMTRMDQYEETLRLQRIETKQYFEELERLMRKQSEDAEKVRRVELRALETSVQELRKELEQIPDLKRQIKGRADEESRLSKLISEVQVRVEAVRHNEDEYNRTYRLLEDGRRQDSKRLTDLTGEVTALNKRFDEQRGRVELNSTTLRRVETRVNEFAVVDTERREAQATFLESQALYQAERERTWKDWQARIALIEAQTADVETSLQTLDATNRTIKGTQQTVDETTAKVERRINEISEIQRLSEERFRQEWVTFRADDQKRWVNFTLTLDEARNETGRQFEKISEQITETADQVQVLNDLMQQITEGIEKRLQSLLTLSHEWVSSHERALGRSR